MSYTPEGLEASSKNDGSNAGRMKERIIRVSGESWASGFPWEWI